MRYVFLTVDLEEFDAPKFYGKDIEYDEMFRVSSDGCKEILDAFDSFGVKSTFFTTTEFARNRPELMEKIVEKGHEIGFHGNVHQTDLPNLPDSRLLPYFKSHKKELERICEFKVTGFRHPKLKTPPYDVLRKARITYDSSIHPTYIPGFYNNFFNETKLYMKDGVLEVPISVVPFVRLPFSWVWFRNFGPEYAKVCSSLVPQTKHPINLYFHPWEFVDLRSYDMPFYMKRNTGKPMKDMFRMYIRWCLNKGFTMSSIIDYIRSHSA